MPRYTNKQDPGIVIDISDGDVLPGGVDAWQAEGGTPRRRRRADTGTVPVQDGH